MDDTYCFACKKSTTNKCTCGGAYYCNKVCQRADWVNHKNLCKVRRSIKKEDIDADMKEALNHTGFVAMAWYNGTYCPVAMTSLGALERARQSVKDQLGLTGLNQSKLSEEFYDQMIRQLHFLELKVAKFGSNKCMDQNDVGNWWTAVLNLVETGRLKEDSKNGIVITKK